MPRIQNVLGWDSYPHIGPYYCQESRFARTGYFGQAASDQLAQHRRIPDGPDNPGNYLGERSSGTYTLIPGRPLSAQTRLKNQQYELPAAGWTRNPDGAPYLLRVPGIPGQQVYMGTVNSFTTQPEFLQPITNLQIQSADNVLSQIRSAIFGQAQQQQLQTNLSTMFPSIYGAQPVTVTLSGQ